jgi:GT2 family glycosyltransferase
MISVVIPYRATDAWRDRSLQYVADHLGVVFPDARVTFADDPNATFNRGRALNAGVRGAGGDALILADADLWVPSAALRYAVSVVAEYGMVVPFDHLVGLDHVATERVYEAVSAPDSVWPDEAVELDWRRRSVGGCNIMRRSVFEAVGGFDERFEGWGSEDLAFEAAVSTLGGPVGWVPARAVHLWHPTDPSRGTELPEANARLAEEYQLAWGDEDAMRALIAREPVG